MRTRTVSAAGADIKVIYLDALVIGSGCAGLNCADTLYNLGYKDIAIVSEGFCMGTSRNTGSDKQTYYKLSTVGSKPDSVYDMAKTLFDGKSVNGDTALAEAASSMKCFMKLALLGVEFPTNEYGEYVGYKTDHDARERATSAGPLTSRYMTEALEREIRRKEIRVFDNTVIFELLVHDGRIYGALGINREFTGSKNFGLSAFMCPNVVMATGGCASVYKRSVYPHSQTGMTGMALRAGAKSANLEEWQYGLASVDFRWNVSGTYQQVIPRYISVDEEGNEYEFLPDALDNPADSANLVFKKGYEWPFDSRKTEGSSKIDMIIYNETVIKGRRVYMDFTREPSILEKGFGALSDEAREYLENSEALVRLPIERLKIMNPKAIELYMTHGIDITREPLRVEVCAQHNNGGLAVDADWQTNISGLYAAGEAAGTFGVYRPGGTALNSTQVGSMRCAEHIARMCRQNTGDENELEAKLEETLSFIRSHLTDRPSAELNRLKRGLTSKFDECCGYIRDRDKIDALIKELNELKDDMKVSDKQLFGYLKFRDMVICMRHIAEAVRYTAAKAGTRGGSIVVGGELTDGSYDGCITVTYEKDGRVFTESESVRPIPESDTWFERVWKDYQRRKNNG